MNGCVAPSSPMPCLSRCQNVYTHAYTNVYAHNYALELKSDSCLSCMSHSFSAGPDATPWSSKSTFLGFIYFTRSAMIFKPPLETFAWLKYKLAKSWQVSDNSRSLVLARLSENGVNSDVYTFRQKLVCVCLCCKPQLKCEGKTNLLTKVYNMT